jgi:hypothetical protein
MFPLISSITPKVSVLRLTDTEQQPLPAASAASIPHKQPAASQSHPPSESLLYTVTNKEVEQQFSGRSDIALFCSWGHAKLSLQIIGYNCAYVKFS